MRTVSLFLRIGRVVTSASVVIIAFAVASVWGQEHDVGAKHRKSVYAVLSEAPEGAQRKKNPFQGDAREATAGGKLFEQHCVECHGKAAGGTRYGPNLLRDEVQHATPGTIFWVLTNGVVRHGMPVWSKLPEPERWQIVTFLQSLGGSSAQPASDH